MNGKALSQPCLERQPRLFPAAHASRMAPNGPSRSTWKCASLVTWAEHSTDQILDPRHLCTVEGPKAGSTHGAFKIGQNHPNPLGSIVGLLLGLGFSGLSSRRCILFVVSGQSMLSPGLRTFRK